MPLSWNVPNPNPEKMCAGAGTHFCGNQLICENPLTRKAYLLTDHSRPSCHFLKIPCPCFTEPVLSLRPNTESEDELATALLPDARDAFGPNDSGDGVVQDELL